MMHRSLPDTAVGGDNSHSQADAYDLPPLPPPVLPESLHGIKTAEVYMALRELRRLIDVPDREPLVRQGLQEQEPLALALFQVLHESGLLKTHPGGQPLPLPDSSAAPSLPPGYRSWLQVPSTGRGTAGGATAGGGGVSGKVGSAAAATATATLVGTPFIVGGGPQAAAHSFAGTRLTTGQRQW